MWLHNLLRFARYIATQHRFMSCKVCYFFRFPFCNESMLSYKWSLHCSSLQPTNLLTFVFFSAATACEKTKTLFTP